MTFQGRLTVVPQQLSRDDYYDGDNEPDAVAAVNAAIEQNDGRTIFFIHLPPKLEGEARENLIKTQNAMRSWQAWSSATCEQKVQAKINGRKLSGEKSKEAMVKRASYRAAVLDYLLKQAPWFAKTFDHTMSKRVTVKLAESHTALVKEALDGFPVPASVLSQLEDIIVSIESGILRVGDQGIVDGQQYWIMLTRYLDDPSGTITTITRVISFRITKQTGEFALAKSKYGSVDFDFTFNQFQCDFNVHIFSAIQEQFDQDVIEKGKELAALKTTEIPVDN